MFSYSSASFSDNGACNKCSSIFTMLEVRLSELEARLCTMETQLLATVVSQPPVAGAGVNQNLIYLAYTVLRNGLNSKMSCFFN